LWEALGDCCAGRDEAANAARCYRNALRVARGESAESIGEGDGQRVDTRASVIEERSEHGVPRLALPRA
jgi:HemY protein